ncbi:hypothetical protein [Frigidibacter sp. MR17.24]|uniref:hypothetical protein n=1 Tax=Frigidibacter sp. MR17.24 TaxID=3127345 RepID=UPI003012DDD5
MTKARSNDRLHAIGGGTALLILAMSLPPVAAQAQSRPGTALAQIDTDGDGAVSRSEAETMAKTRFTRLDRDGDGAISPEEFAAPRQAAFAAADRDRDGKLERGELRAAAGAL